MLMYFSLVSLRITKEALTYVFYKCLNINIMNSTCMHMNIYVSKSWKHQNLIGWQSFSVEMGPLDISQENNCILN